MENTAISASIMFQLGPVEISNTVVTTWAIMVISGLLAWLTKRSLTRQPGPVQTIAEAVVCTIETAIDEVAPEHTRQLLPFIGTLWLFLVIANLSGLVPGIHSPTRDLSATSGLAIVVFFSAHWFGIRAQGLKNYLRHYLSPSPIMLPFHIVSEITRTIALAVRLFGNMMSLEMTALLVLLVAGFLAPIPILMLHIIEALVQAYIFGMLALIFVAGGLQSQQITQRKQQSNLASKQQHQQKD